MPGVGSVRILTTGIGKYDFANSTSQNTSVANSFTQSELTVVLGPNLAQLALSSLTNGILVYSVDTAKFYCDELSVSNVAGQEGLSIVSPTGGTGSPTFGLNINGLSSYTSNPLPTDQLVLFNGTNNLSATIAQLTGSLSTTLVPIVGATMTGPLILVADPTVNLGAATKQYVDNSFDITNAGPLPFTVIQLAGSSLGTGFVTYGDSTFVTRHLHANTVAGYEGIVIGNANAMANPTVGFSIDNLASYEANPSPNDQLVMFNGTNNLSATLAQVTTTLSSSFLSVLGGTMIGSLLLSADPTQSLGAVTKNYVDNAAIVAANTYVFQSGSTMTGPLILSTDPVTPLGAATKQYVDNSVSSISPVSTFGSTMTGSLILSGNPSTALAAAPKQYVDYRASIYDSISFATSATILSNISVIRTNGYAIGGDGGGGLYKRSSTQPSVANSYFQTLDGSFWVIAEYPNVKMFGAKGNGTTDDTAAFQSAVNFGGLIAVPPGNYVISAPIVISIDGTRLVGSGEYLTTISCNSSTNDIFVLNTVNQCSIERLSITSTVAKTSGAGIFIEGSTDIRVDHVLMSANMFTGIQLDGGSSYHVSNFEINSGTVGIMVGTITTVNDVYIFEGVISSTNLHGILLKNANGAYLRNIHLTNGMGNGVTVSPPSGGQVTTLYCINVTCDTFSQYCWALIAGSGIVKQISLTDCWTFSAGQAVNSSYNGFYINGVTDISIVSPKVINCGGSGMFITNTIDLRIVNPIVYSNSGAGSNLKHGIEIDANMSGWSIIGGICGSSGFTNFQSFGIYIRTGTSNRFSILGTNVVGNISGGISNNSTGSEQYIKECPGYIAPYISAANDAAAAIAGVLVNGIYINGNVLQVRLT